LCRYKKTKWLPGAVEGEWDYSHADSSFGSSRTRNERTRNYIYI